MLKQFRVIVAAIIGALITLLFLDFTGSVHAWFGWIAKIQLLPAILSFNVAIVVGLVVLTLIFGRLYCSVICPLGIFQDVVSRLNLKKNRYSYSPSKSWLRYVVMALFIVAFVAGLGSVASLIAPYSAFGRMASNLLAPIYGCGNNLLAYFAERMDSYAFYHHDVYIKSVATFIVSLATFAVVALLAWRNGRTYCNTICPVGTLLGFISNFSLLKVRIDTQKCNSCGLCARNCKSSCIDAKSKEIDYSRCVSCFSCIERCNRGALSYSLRVTAKEESTDDANSSAVDQSRRNMLTITGALVATTALKAQEAKVDGGLAYIEDKKIPARQTPIVPAGALSIRNFASHCTGCQLCVSVCPNDVLRPSSKMESFMQPEMSYERGYCRPECTKCSQVCPVGAIRPISCEDKSSTQIGHAVWIEKNCVVLTDDVNCGNCARHCPTGAIKMVVRSVNDPKSKKIPVVDKERCIGCGACENLCPSRPFSAIYVEGHKAHRTI